MNLEQAQAVADEIHKAQPNDLNVKARQCRGDPSDVRLEIEIKVGEGSILVGHLDPSKADWDTYYLFVKAIESAHRVGIRHGLKLARQFDH